VIFAPTVASRDGRLDTGLIEPMPRREADEVDVAVLTVLIAIGAALYFAFPIIAATIVSGTFTGLIVGLIASEYRARPRPAITTKKQLD
jgi:hypothetical protein